MCSKSFAVTKRVCEESHCKFDLNSEPQQMQEVRTKNLKHRYFSDRKVFVGQVQLKDKRPLSPKRVEPQACHSLTVLITSQCTCNDLADDKDDDHDKHHFVFAMSLNISSYSKLKTDHKCLFVCLRQLGSKLKYIFKIDIFGLKCHLNVQSFSS